MELHHDKHHRTYVNSYNAAMDKMEEIQSNGDVAGQIAQQPLINFHGGVFILLETCLCRSDRCVQVVT